MCVRACGGYVWTGLRHAERFVVCWRFPHVPCLCAEPIDRSGERWQRQRTRADSTSSVSPRTCSACLRRWATHGDSRGGFSRLGIKRASIFGGRCIGRRSHTAVSTQHVGVELDEFGASNAPPAAALLLMAGGGVQAGRASGGCGLVARLHDGWTPVKCARAGGSSGRRKCESRGQKPPFVLSGSRLSTEVRKCQSKSARIFG